MFSAEVGYWASRYPIGLSNATNPISYAHSNGISARNPNSLSPLPCGGSFTDNGSMDAHATAEVGALGTIPPCEQAKRDCRSKLLFQQIEIVAAGPHCDSSSCRSTLPFSPGCEEFTRFNPDPTNFSTCYHVPPAGYGFPPKVGVDCNRDWFLVRLCTQCRSLGSTANADLAPIGK
jgi:hypothetical protein